MNNASGQKTGRMELGAQGRGSAHKGESRSYRPRHKSTTVKERKMKWQEEAEKRRADVAVNWAAYFESIKTACPWSWSAQKKSLIDIQHWHSQAQDLEHYEARIYTAPNHKPRQLKKITDRLNRDRPLEEWLWSHPKYGHNSTPVPVLIQQDRSRLESIRKNLKNNKVYK